MDAFKDQCWLQCLEILWSCSNIFQTIEAVLCSLHCQCVSCFCSFSVLLNCTFFLSFQGFCGCSCWSISRQSLWTLVFSLGTAARSLCWISSPSNACCSFDVVWANAVNNAFLLNNFRRSIAINVLFICWQIFFCIFCASVKNNFLLL